MRDVNLRSDVRPDDVAVVRGLVATAGVFNDDELDIAVDLIEGRLRRGAASRYDFVFAEKAGRTIGYVCYGRVPGTLASHDLYWIVVEAGHQRAGIGGALLAECEHRSGQEGGSRLYVDMTSKPSYAPARAFYERHGFVEVARLDDFYAPDDDKIIFVKELW
jgi:ribosomal protein S18 acetylase RimI-like enzyme